MSVPITRETFIAANHIQVALSQKTMWDLSKDGELIEVPIPESFKKSGIPEGYSIDFIMDPATLVTSLAQSKNAITTENQLPEGLLDELKATINASTNLRIMPTSIYEQKRASVDAVLEKYPGEEVEGEEVVVEGEEKEKE